MTNTLSSAAVRLNQLFYERQAGPAIKKLPAILLMSDVARLENPSAVLSMLPPRLSGVIVRHTNRARLKSLVTELKPLCEEYNVNLLISNDLGLFHLIGADGVHFAERDLPDRETIAAVRTRPDVLITAAAHSFEAVMRAADAGVDAALASPVFATESHPEKEPLGAVTFRTWCAKSPIPLYALGGVSLQTVDAIMDSGAVGVAGIGGFLSGEG